MTQHSTSEQPSLHAFVGRKRELEELRAGLDDAIGGHGRLFLLAGEPGIGKTRLAEELARLAVTQAVPVLWGRCWEGGGAPAYWPLIQIIRACVDGRDAEQLKGMLGAGTCEIVQLIPELGPSLPSQEETRSIADPESARFRLFDSVATLLKNAARIAPLLIVIDDLHDADQPSLQMLRFIAREIKAARLVMLGTYRDAEVRQSPDLGRLISDLNREGRTVPLAGLSQGEVGQFVERSWGQKAEDKLVADLYRATDGNPLFVDGVVRLLVAERELEGEGLDSHAFKIPDGVRESIRRGLTTLSKETNSLLSIASIIGNEFEARLLERVSGRSVEQIVEQMEEAARMGTVNSEAGPGLVRYRFSHGLIREAIYGDIPAKRRMELHGAIGAALEEIHQGDLNPYLAALAHHFTEAGVSEKATGYSIAAGEAANAIFAYEDATLRWEAALRLMEEHGSDQGARARLMLRLATTVSITNPDEPQGSHYLEQALGIYERSGEVERAARVHLRLGNCFCPGQLLQTFGAR